MTTTPTATRATPVPGVATPSVADRSRAGRANMASRKLEAAHAPAAIRWQAVPAAVAGGYLAGIGRPFSPA